MDLGTGFFIWAHRGASAYAPENTLAAFRLAEDLGADGIELDVHLSNDGVPVVLHDDTLQRTTDGHGKVQRATLQRLQRLDAGSWFAPQFAGEPVPQLEEVLRWIGPRLPLNIEIKTAEAALGVLALVRQYPAVRVLISSFNPDALEVLRAEDADLPLAFLTEGYFWRRSLARARAAKAFSFHPAIERFSPAMCTEVLAEGLRLYPYTVDDPALVATLKGQGVAGIFTNGLFPRRPAVLES